MKIKMKNFNQDELSASAKMTRFFIKINLLPVYSTSNFENVTFSWMSLRTLVYLLITYLPVPMLVILFKLQPEFAEKYFEEVGKYYATIDIMAIFTFVCMPLLVGPILMLLISHFFSYSSNFPPVFPVFMVFPVFCSTTKYYVFMTT